MKITEEWIRDEISKCEKNLQFAKDKNYENLIEWYKIELGVWNHVLLKKIMSGRTVSIHPIGFPKWKKWIIKKLHRIINKLEGVEDL